MYIYGYHPCKAALANPSRIIEKIYITDEKILSSLNYNVNNKIEIINSKTLERKLPEGAIHQGITLLVQPFNYKDIHFLENDSTLNQCVLLLDQVCDPHNIGAILRSSAVFGAKALIVTDRHAPKESGVIAKSACGALEITPLCYVKNLAQTIEQLKMMNYWCIGFSEMGDQTFEKIDLKGKIALILGSEGEGIRQKTKSLCDFHVRLPTTDLFSTLNVSNAAAIALYEVFKCQN